MDTATPTLGAGARVSSGEASFAAAAPTGGPPPDSDAPLVEPAPARTGIPHFPALEGLRGLAVAGVVLFHAGFGWMRGGFLGVSTFFTLSGFLITSLLLAERRTTGGIDLRRFWLRRFRRLMPASLAALALVALFGAVAADAVQRRNLAGDVLASLGYVANWRFVLAQQAYADIFGDASPVAHFWSLAIEEQFYLIMPVLAWVLLARLQLRRSAFAAVLAGLAAASIALGLFAGLPGDAAYFNTGTRAVELLAGALLATVVFDRRITLPLGTDTRVQVGVGAVGLLALAGAIWLWTFAEQAGEGGAWLYHGGLPGYAAVSALIILAAIAPAGPVRWLLALWPLRALGAISYGVYLYHWPVFLWLDAERTGWSQAPLFAARAAVTLALAVASYHLIETPIRRRSSGAARRPVWPAAPVVVGGIAAAVVAVTLVAPPPAIDIDRATAELAAASRRAGPAVPPPDAAVATPPFPRAAFFGDSTAVMTGSGFGEWAVATKQADVVEGYAKQGCGIGRGGERRDVDGKPVTISDGCNRWPLFYRQAVENNQPNIAVVQTGPWEVVDRRMEGSDRWVTLGDADYDRFLLGEMEDAVDVLTARGAVVVWLTAPPMGHPQDNGPKTGQRDPARVQRLNELIRELPTRRPGKVAVVDLGGWVAARASDDERLRPDGYHFVPATSLEVSQTFLAEAILRAFRDTWRQRAADLTAGSGGGDGAASLAGVGRYLEHYRAVVVADPAAAPVAEAIAAWGRRTGALDVTVSVTPDCGLLETMVRAEQARPAPTPAACRPPAQAALAATAAGRPDLVIVLPSAWDTGDSKLAGTEAYSTWTGAEFAKVGANQYVTRTKAFNKSGSVVLWVNAPVGDPARREPGSPTLVLGATDAARAARFDAALAEVAGAVPGSGAQRVDLAAWAARGLPSIAGGSRALDAAAITAVGDWLAAQAYLQYDAGEKLQPPRPRAR
jgi:peptidoglycan/LPS O-acetylase OafA/YrhL